MGIKSGTNINTWLGGIGLATIEDIAVNFTPIKLQGLSNLSNDLKGGVDQFYYREIDTLPQKHALGCFL